MRLWVDGPFTPAERLETTRTYSAMGLLKPGLPLGSWDTTHNSAP